MVMEMGIKPDMILVGTQPVQDASMEELSVGYLIQAQQLLQKTVLLVSLVLELTFAELTVRELIALLT
jgi:hypothetical protein